MSNILQGLTIASDIDKSKQDVLENLDINQKRAGQLGPTEKITKKNPLRGKLVGANENYINTDDQPVAEAKPSAAVRMQREIEKQRAKSDASLQRTPSSIPKKEEPKKQSEQDVSEEKIKGADGNVCWKNKRYAGTKNGKDICIPVKESSILKGINKRITSK